MDQEYSVVFSSESAYSGVLPKKKSKKKWIIAGAAVALVGIGVAIWFLLIAPSFLMAKEEAGPKIENFYTQYERFINAYDATISFAPQNNISDETFVPIQGDAAVSVKNNLVVTRDLHLEVKGIGGIRGVSGEANDNLASAVVMAEDFLGVAERNIDIALRFNEAFAEPIIAMVRSGKNTNCAVTDKAKQLSSDGDGKVASAAKAYSDVYCEVANIAVSGGTPSAQLQNRIREAKRSLAQALVDYDRNNTGFSQLVALRAELRL